MGFGDFFADADAEAVLAAEDSESKTGLSELQSGSDQTAAETVTSSVSAADYGGRVMFDDETRRTKWFVLLTVPDESRFDQPSVVAVGDQERVDLATLPKMSAAEVKNLVTATLPDDQLVYLRDFEAARDKCRSVAIRAIDGELLRRGPAVCRTCGQEQMSVDRWIVDYAANPYTCRVVAAAVAVGDGDSQIFIEDRDGSESELLSCVWECLGSSLSEEPIGGVRMLDRWTVFQVRSIALAVAERRAPLIFPMDTRAAKSVDINDLAAAYGLSVPPVASAAAVFHAVQEKQFRKLATMVSDRLESERAILLAERSVS